MNVIFSRTASKEGGLKDHFHAKCYKRVNGKTQAISLYSINLERFSYAVYSNEIRNKYGLCDKDQERLTSAAADAWEFYNHEKRRKESLKIAFSKISNQVESIIEGLSDEELESLDIHLSLLRSDLKEEMDYRTKRVQKKWGWATILP